METLPPHNQEKVKDAPNGLRYGVGVGALKIPWQDASKVGNAVTKKLDGQHEETDRVAE